MILIASSAWIDASLISDSASFTHYTLVGVSLALSTI